MGRAYQERMTGLSFEQRRTAAMRREKGIIRAQTKIALNVAREIVQSIAILAHLQRRKSQ